RGLTRLRHRYPLEQLVELGLPQTDATGDARRVADDLDVRRHFQRELARVAAADVEHVTAGETCHGVYRPACALVPALTSPLRQRRLPDVLIVSFALAHAVLAKLQVEQQASVTKERATHTRPQREDAFKTRALDHAEALHGGIVENP